MLLRSRATLLRAPQHGLRMAHTAHAIVFSDYGNPKESVHLRQFEIPDPGENDVILKLLAAPINPADLNQIEGVYPSKPRFGKLPGSSDEVAIGGNEGLFEVVALGAQAEEHERKLKVGDWVLPLKPSFGTWSTYLTSQPENLINLGVARGLDKIAAATVSVNPSTAYRMLSDFVHLEPGDWFIQNGGNSGVGRMAIQLGKLWGYKSISVVRDRKDIEQMKAELTDLGADQVITEEQLNDKSIKHVLEDWTHGQGIKLGLNCVGGRSVSNLARQLGQNGQLVTYGGMSRQPVSLPSGLAIFKNISTHGFWMTRWSDEHKAGRERMILELVDMFRQNELRVTGAKTHEVTPETLLEVFKSAVGEPGKHVIVPASK